MQRYWMKKYISYLRLRFAMGLQYRAAALAGIITQFAWGAMEIMVFKAFYQTNSAAFPMSFSAVVSYTWFQQAFLALFAVWMMENEIFDSIMNGNIAYELCRPVHIYDMWFVRGVALRTSRAILRCIPILLVAVILPEPYRLMPPESSVIFLLFLFSMLLALLVVVAFITLIYVCTFFTISPQGIRMVVVSVMEFFSGAVIPLPFFPDNLRRIMEILPFASMQNVPLRIYSGDIAGTEITEKLCLQIAWLILLIIAGKVLCNVAERKVTVQGG